MLVGPESVAPTIAGSFSEMLDLLNENLHFNEIHMHFKMHFDLEHCGGAGLHLHSA